MKADITGWDENNSDHKPTHDADTEVIFNPKHNQLIDRCNGKDNETLTIVSGTQQSVPTISPMTDLSPIITLLKKVTINVDTATGHNDNSVTSALTTDTKQADPVAPDVSSLATNESIKSMISTKSKAAIKRVKQQAHKELKEVVKSHTLALQESADLLDQKEDKIAVLKAQVKALLSLQSLVGANSKKLATKGHETSPKAACAMSGTIL